MECSFPKRDKANRILTMNYLILNEIVNFFLRNFSTMYTVRNSKKNDFM